MKICEFCKSENPDHAAHCQFCMAPFPEDSVDLSNSGSESAPPEREAAYASAPPAGQPPKPSELEASFPQQTYAAPKSGQAGAAGSAPYPANAFAGGAGSPRTAQPPVPAGTQQEQKEAWDDGWNESDWIGDGERVRKEANVYGDEEALNAYMNKKKTPRRPFVFSVGATIFYVLTLLMIVYAVMAFVESGKISGKLDGKVTILKKAEADPANDGKLVLVSGKVKWEPVQRPMLPERVQSPLVEEIVERYEEREKDGKVTREWKRFSGKVTDKDGNEFKTQKYLAPLSVGDFEIEGTNLNFEYFNRIKDLFLETSAEHGYYFKKRVNADPQASDFRVYYRYADSDLIDEITLIAYQNGSMLCQEDPAKESDIKGFAAAGTLSFDEMCQVGAEYERGDGIALLVMALIFIGIGLALQMRRNKKGPRRKAKKAKR